MNIKNNSFTHYGTWKYDRYSAGVIELDFELDEIPVIDFPAGRVSLIKAHITENYFYATYQAFDSKNPNRRLPIKKIK